MGTIRGCYSAIDRDSNICVSGTSSCWLLLARACVHWHSFHTSARLLLLLPLLYWDRRLLVVCRRIIIESWDWSGHCWYSRIETKQGQLASVLSCPSHVINTFINSKAKNNDMLKNSMIRFCYLNKWWKWQLALLMLRALSVHEIPIMSSRISVILISYILFNPHGTLFRVSWASYVIAKYLPGQTHKMYACITTCWKRRKKTT